MDERTKITAGRKTGGTRINEVEKLQSKTKGGGSRWTSAST